jgi:MFS superfamily sulfate permease-like transporter
MDAERPVAPWRQDVLGALAATAAMLPFVLSFGFIVYGALGGAAAQVGLTASLVAVVLGGGVMLGVSRTRLPAASPSASASLILGGAVLAMWRDPALSAPAGLPVLLAGTAAVVVASGLTMVVLGLAGAGRLVRYVPQPVLAGFMNGVALLIVVSQLPPLLGLPAGAWQREGFGSLTAWQGPALGVAAATAALMVLIGRRWPRAPAPMLALAIGGLAVGVAQALAAPGSGLAALPRVGEVVIGWPRWDALAPWAERAHWALLAPHAATLATTALILALIGTLESALNLAAVDQQAGDRSDPNRELLAIGVANVASGALGGLPLVYLRLRALATWSGGGRSARSIALGCLLLAVIFLLALPLIERLATAVVAGIVVMLAWSLVDRWTRQRVRQWARGERSAALHWNLLVVAVVCAVTLWWGFAVGVLAGLLVALWLFVRAMNQQLVRSRSSAAALPSRRVYSAAAERRLAAQRERIVVFELEGALFFGSAERLLEAADTLPPATHTLVVDLRRITTLDASGALALATLAQRLAARGITLRLAAVGDTAAGRRHAQALAAHGVTLAGRGPAGGLLGHADLDRAIEAAEQELLAETDAPEHTITRTGLPLPQCQLFEGLDARQTQALRALMQPRNLATGERLFGEGDAGDGLYVLSAGSVSVVSASRGQRFASFSPGMSFGETALLDGQGRTADAVADVPSVVHLLSAQALAQLSRDDPALAAHVYRNLATHLSQRLRAAAAAWRHAAE